jgi:hypothetical protein
MTIVNEDLSKIKRHETNYPFDHSIIFILHRVDLSRSSERSNQSTVITTGADEKNRGNG